MSDFKLTSSSEILPKPPFVNPEEKNFADKSFLLAVLYAIRLNFYKLLDLKNIELSFSDYIKQQWKLNNKVEYPRSYVSLSSIEILRDRGNNRAIRHAGMNALRESVNNSTGNYLKQAKTFPVKLSMELHFFESDMHKAIFMLENIAVVTAMGGFSFTVIIQDKFEYQARVIFEDNLSLPIVDLSNDSDPGSIELTFPFTVETYIGKIEDTARAYVLTNSNLRNSVNLRIDDGSNTSI